jgi:hypothetical protein
MGGTRTDEILKGGTLFVHDTSTEPHSAAEREVLQAAAIGAYICPLLVKDGRFVGAFAVHSREPRVRVGAHYLRGAVVNRYERSAGRNLCERLDRAAASEARHVEIDRDEVEAALGGGAQHVHRVPARLRLVPDRAQGGHQPLCRNAVVVTNHHARHFAFTSLIVRWKLALLAGSGRTHTPRHSNPLQAPYRDCRNFDTGT